MEPFIKTIQRDPSQWPALRRQLEQEIADDTALLQLRTSELEAIRQALKRLDDRADAAETLRELETRTGIRMPLQSLALSDDDMRYVEFLRTLELGASRITASLDVSVRRGVVHLNLLSQFERGTHYSQNPVAAFAHRLFG